MAKDKKHITYADMDSAEVRGAVLSEVTAFNDTEGYWIDFANCTFVYSRRTIRYVYSWRGDTGTMDACSYDFKTQTASDSCQDSTVETIQDVKKYFEMELYYCGLTLEDLQKEAQ